MLMVKQKNILNEILPVKTSTSFELTQKFHIHAVYNATSVMSQTSGHKANNLGTLGCFHKGFYFEIVQTLFMSYRCLFGLNRAKFELVRNFVWYA